LVDVLPVIAEELRRDARVRAEAAARSAGVRAVLPLVACFLPAFLLIGVVPVVASLAQSLWK
jgi:pilus assembly protein TadC